jgi:hypothetical protein
MDSVVGACPRAHWTYCLDGLCVGSLVDTLGRCWCMLVSFSYQTPLFMFPQTRVTLHFTSPPCSSYLGTNQTYSRYDYKTSRRRSSTQTIAPALAPALAPAPSRTGVMSPPPRRPRQTSKMLCREVYFPLAPHPYDVARVTNATVG